MIVAVDSSLEFAMRLVRTVEVRRGIVSSELVERPSKGRKFRYGSLDFRSALDNAGTTMIYEHSVSLWTWKKTTSALYHLIARVFGQQAVTGYAMPGEDEGSSSRTIKNVV